MIQLLLALLAGCATIASPCVLPMLPILLSSAIGASGRARPLLIVLGFVAAFSAGALLFGLFSEVLPLSQQLVRDAAAVLLLVFGLLMAWPRPFQGLSMLLTRHLDGIAGLAGRAGDGRLGGLVLGMTLGAVWTPCAGPILASILTLVATAHDLGRATAMLLIYSIGAGLPMLAVVVGGRHATARVRRLARHAARMQQAFGLLVMLTAAAMYWQYDVLATAWLTGHFPVLDVGL